MNDEKARRKFSNAYAEIWFYTLGKGSHINTVGKIVFFPIILIMLAFFGTFATSRISAMVI
jgi:hypothetical protein